VNDLPLPVSKADVKAKASAAPSRYVFTEERVSFAGLRDVDAEGDIAIDRLLLREGRHVDSVRATIALRDGVLDVRSAQFIAFGGTIRAKLRIDARRDPDDALSLDVDAKGLDLGALALAAGVPRDIKGGKTDIAIDVAMRGASPRQWASTASGTVNASVGPATIANPKAKDGSPADQLASAVNPFRNVSASTELKCAVVRLPLRNGVARFDRTVALETRELGVAASGTIDLRSETLDFAVKPQLKQGIPIDLVQVSNLVRVAGPLTAPSVRMDAAATAATVARIGAAASAGGWSAVAGTLLKAPAAGDANTCDVAAGRAPREAAPATAGGRGKPAPIPADELSKALGRLLGGK
jgi:uncharacterized protein involved in outer membrane biogenesis